MYLRTHEKHHFIWKHQETSTGEGGGHATSLQCEMSVPGAHSPDQVDTAPPFLLLSDVTSVPTSRSDMTTVRHGICLLVFSVTLIQVSNRAEIKTAKK